MAPDRFKCVQTLFSKRLGLEGPLVQAPMAGAASTPEFVAAASNAGALGSLGGAYLQPDELEKAIRQTRALTARSFSVNLFSPSPPPVLDPVRVHAALVATNSYRRELGLPEKATVSSPFCPDFRAQLAVVIRERPPVFSFTFGLLSSETLGELRELGIFTIGTATCLKDALALQASGVDAVVAQGFEAGAHRGTFLTDEPDLELGTFALVPQLVSHLSVPVLAAGGMMDGRGIAAALALGAQGAQLGTAFLACDESGISSTYRNALLEMKTQPTRMTKAFSGRWARGIENRFLREMASSEEAVLPFPAQNSLTQDVRKEAGRLGRAEFLSLWAGEGVAAIRTMKVGLLVETLFAETAAALQAVALLT